MEACRACLSTAENKVPFDDNLIHGYNLLTNLNIKPLDGLSQHVCEICFNTLISFLNFREQCITSESTLQQKLSQTIKIELMSIKSEPSEIETIVKTEIPVKRKVGRPRKEASIKGNEELGCLNKNDTTTEPPIKRRIWRPSKTAFKAETTRNTWVVRPRENILTTGTVSNGCVEHSRKDTSTTTKGKKWVICPRKTENEVKSSNLAIKKEIESPDGNSDNLDIEIQVDISNNLVKKEGLKDVIKSKIIKPAEDKEDDDKDDKDYEDDTDEDDKYEDYEETSIPCGLCKKKLEDQESLSSHLESHRSCTRCETCQETFVEWQALLAHRLVHVKSRKSHKCHICHKRQWSPLFFEYHYLCEHSDKNVQDIKMTCKICLKKYSDPKKMKRHLKNEHKDVRYTCDKCSKAFAYKFHLRLHERKHFDEKPFVCDMCDFQSKFKNSLRVHVLKKHSESSAYCTKCSRVFAKQEYLERHVCADKVQVCPICGIVSKYLKGHMRVHNDVRKFACARCPATFKGKVALQVHMNKHDDLRPYGCEFCPMRFNSSTVLIKHRRVHTGEKPYVCKVCDKGFTGNHNLKVHMRVHGEDLVVKRNAVPAAEN